MPTGRPSGPMTMTCPVTSVVWSGDSLIATSWTAGAPRAGSGRSTTGRCHQHDLADDTARVERGVRLGGLLDREGVLHDRTDPAVADHRPHQGAHRLDDPALALRTVDRPAAQPHRRHPAPSAQQGGNVELAL